MSWQEHPTTLRWPIGFSQLGEADNGYSFVAVGANLAGQNTASLPAQTVGEAVGEAVVLTVQVAVSAG